MTDQTTSKEHLEVDLAKYNTPELVSNLTQLIGVPFSVKTIPLAAVLSGILALAVSYLGFKQRIQEPQLWFFVVACVLVAFFLGGGTALVLLFNRAIGSSLGLMESGITLSEQVIRDSASVSDGTKLPPRPSHVVQAFYDQILIPTVLQYAQNIFLFGGLIVWFYNKTLRWLVNKVVGLLTNKMDKRESNKELDEQKAKLSAQAIQESATRSVERLEKARNKIAKYGGRIRTVVIGPLVFLLLFAAFILVGGLGVIAFFMMFDSV